MATRRMPVPATLGVAAAVGADVGCSTASFGVVAGDMGRRGAPRLERDATVRLYTPLRGHEALGTLSCALSCSHA